MFNTLSHLAVPGYSNNFKARLIQVEGIIVMFLLIVFSQSLLEFASVSKVAVLGYAANISTSKVIELTNEKRSEIGLNKLEYSDQLAEAAQKKGEDMLLNNYWAHVSPSGVEPWEFFKNVGYNYRYAGENLARDFSNPQSAIDAWMASPSHKDNMLSPKYTQIGVAVVEGDLDGVDTTIIVQLFGTPSAAVAEVPTAAAASNVPPAEINAPTQEITKEAVNSETNSQILAHTPKNTIFISPFDTTKTISVFVVGSVLGVMVIDMVELKRKGVKRVGSKTFAHFSFMIMVLAIILVSQSGKIL